MTNRIRFSELRQLLLDLGFLEVSQSEQIVFGHKPSDTLFVFRPYRPADPVASYHLIDVKTMLDARGLLSADSFENHLRKAPA